MSMLGAPSSQREQIDHGYPGGLEKIIIHCLQAIFTRLSFTDNCFWRVYLTGEHSLPCRPEYLKKNRFFSDFSGICPEWGIF